MEKEPETRSIKITKKIDVWALGIILYQIVYGFQPFHQVPGGRMSKIIAVSSLLHPVEFDEKDSMALIAEVCGLADSLFSGGRFKLKMNFCKEYPLKPPRVKFITKI